MPYIPVGLGLQFIEQYINVMNMNTLVQIHGLYIWLHILQNVTTYPMLCDHLPHTRGMLSLVSTSLQ